MFRILAAAALTLPSAAGADATRPPEITVDAVPAVPDAIVADTRPYLQMRHAQFLGWRTSDRSMLIKTRFASTDQLHSVAAPAADRTQLTFEDEPILSASLSPGIGDALVVQKDVGGGEFYQLFRLQDGRLHLLTDGRSRNWLGGWSRDGSLLGYSSTRRNGADADLYVIDPRRPASDRRVAEVRGGGWNIADFLPDGRTALAINRESINKSSLHRLDLASGKMTPLTDPRATIYYQAPQVAADGAIWVLSDEGGDVVRLGRLDARGRFVAVSREPRWDVTDYALAPDGRFVVYALNDAGVSRVRVLDVASGRVRTVDALPAGVIPWSTTSAIQVSPWGTIGLSLSSARVAGDAFSVDPVTLAVTRWTASETGGLDPANNREPDLIELASFDGERISGLLYRPDAARFPGRRPLIVEIHGGPEGQTRPEHLGAYNYYLNELGIALFYPNVRGSSGYGRRFVNLDNGPMLRENAVLDIGAFLDRLGVDATLDPARFAVSGLSYGGYMCYATAIRYSDRLRGANCYVAISNFVTFLENTQSYRRDLRRVEYGDERDPVQRAQLAAISPLTNAARIRVPLMIATGGNDPRVPASEAHQMVAAVRTGGGQVWHLTAENDGHVFRKKENADYYFWASVLFWQRELIPIRSADVTVPATPK